jgi:hypothetical protein
MKASIQWMRAAIAVAMLFLATSNSQAFVIWDEAVDGDLADAGSPSTAPTDINVSAGTNSVIGGMPGSDMDFLTIFVPEDHEFTGLVLASYVSTETTAFIAIRAGEINPPTNNPALLLGYTHFGTGPGNVGEDILDDMGLGGSAQGFTPPLPSGNYTFWLQEAENSTALTYQFDFIIEEIPPPEILIGDYNGDNKVTAADYTVWRDHYGASTLTNRDPDNVGPVGDDDFDSWLENYGMTLEGSGNGSALSVIPEPGTFLLIVVAMIGWMAHRLRGN